jgi:hypothetical protein
MLYATRGQGEQARTVLIMAIEMYRAMDMTFWLPQAEAALAQVECRVPSGCQLTPGAHDLVCRWCATVVGGAVSDTGAERRLRLCHLPFHPLPNKGLQATANSVRSAAAARRA